MLCNIVLLRLTVSKKGPLHVDITTFVTYSIACCLLVYITTRGLLVAWPLGYFITRTLQLLWCLLLLFAPSGMRLLTTELVAYINDFAA